ncbi:MAG: NADH:flavin oxidoreductase/NADH oxidase [Kyrpidia tusciae]|nr:NADH:flavin oxidoreductase/NADH oxidase [Kyrpidia tusciae]MBE3551581.1 NADH:flavin oxidoreductase/NADH oxidase [Kyrpidia tusciae]
MPTLFEPFTIKNLTLRNRVVMPPMCQYSVTAKDGKPNDWHFVHYTSRAVGGAGLIIIEMTDVEPDGRLTDYDLGLWSDDQVPAFRRVIDACHAYGSKVAIQIGHAGRKAEDAPTPVAPSPIRFSDRYKVPRQLTTEEVRNMVAKFEAAFRRALEAGVDAIEIHGAHGYLIHQFHSPLTNRRTDEYGQDRLLFGVEVIKAARRVLPESMPIFMRISAVEYVDGGYGLEQSVEFCRRYREAGVDLFHVSSGGEGPIGSGGVPGAEPGYQVEYAHTIRRALGVPVIAVGKLQDPRLANRVIEEEKADLVAVGRGMLRNPYWANEASLTLGGSPLTPKAYERAYRL